MSWAEAPFYNPAADLPPLDSSIVTLPSNRNIYSSGTSYLQDKHLIVANNTCGDAITGTDKYSLIVKIQNHILERPTGFKKEDLSIYTSYQLNRPVPYSGLLKEGVDYFLDPEKGGWVLFKNLVSGTDYNFYFLDSKEDSNLLNFPLTQVSSWAQIYCANSKNKSTKIPLKTMQYLNQNNGAINTFVYTTPSAIAKVADNDRVSANEVSLKLTEQIMNNAEFYQMALSRFGKQFEIINWSQPSFKNPFGLNEVILADGSIQYKHQGLNTIISNDKKDYVSTVTYDAAGNIIAQSKNPNEEATILEKVILSVQCIDGKCQVNTPNTNSSISLNPNTGTYSPVSAGGVDYDILYIDLEPESEDNPAPVLTRSRDSSDQQGNDRQSIVNEENSDSPFSSFLVFDRIHDNELGFSGGSSFDINSPADPNSDVFGNGAFGNNDSDQNNEEVTETEEEEAARRAAEIEQATPRTLDTSITSLSQVSYRQYKNTLHGMVLKKTSNSSACRVTKNLNNVGFIGRGDLEAPASYALLLQAYQNQGQPNCP